MGGFTPPAVLLDWVRVIADALLLGGVATAAWGRRHRPPRASRDHIWARLLRVALPASLVAALTAVISAFVGLRRPVSSYGVAVLVELMLLGGLAGWVSAAHSIRCQPPRWRTGHGPDAGAGPHP